MTAGRPKAKAGLTAAQIERLAKIGCSDDEIAALAGIAESTLQENFRAHLTKGRANLRERLRRRQLRRALDDGSDTMLIWLGKQYLGQRDKADLSAEVSTTVKGYIGVSPDDWDADSPGPDSAV